MNVLSLLKVFLESGAELFRILDELLLALLDRLFAGRAWNETDHLVHRVQQLFNGTGDFPGFEQRWNKQQHESSNVKFINGHRSFSARVDSA